MQHLSKLILLCTYITYELMAFDARVAMGLEIPYMFILYDQEYTIYIMCS